MRYFLLIPVALIFYSCEDKLYKDKYDVEFYLTNKTSSVIQKIKIDAYYGKKVWTFEDIKPDETEKLRFNIKRDIKYSEGSFEITAFFGEVDSVTINTGYFTNWGYVASNPSSFYIYEDRIELQK